MSDPFQNLQEKTGRTMPEWFAVLDKAVPNNIGLGKHSEVLAWLKREHGVSHGFANGIALQYRARGTAPAPDDDLIAAQYAGPKESLIPIRDALLAAAESLGDDVQIAPKKSGISLRRKTQFALLEAASAQRIQLGLQLRDHPTTERLLVGNAMCSHRVNVTQLADVDDELRGWLAEAYARN